LFSDVQYEARDDFNDDIKSETDAANYDATEINANGNRHAVALNDGHANQ
jgi:hypothetical protein